jgi:hypothetical protein
MKIRLAILTLAFCAAIASAAPRETAATATAGTAEPRAMAEQMLKFLPKDDLTGLFALMQKFMPLPKDEINKLRDTTIEQRKQIVAGYGSHLGNSFISECRRSEVLSRVIFIEKRVKMFVRWEFTFYKPRDKWQMSSFVWDTKNDHLFEACD